MLLLGHLKSYGTLYHKMGAKYISYYTILTSVKFLETVLHGSMWTYFNHFYCFVKNTVFLSLIFFLTSCSIVLIKPSSQGQKEVSANF